MTDQQRRGIDIAHILTTIGMCVGGLLYIADMDRRIHVNATNIQNSEKDTQRIEKRLEKMDAKLDRILEKG